MAGHSAIDLARSGEQQEKITIAFLALAWCFILLRIWTRTYVISNFGWDDSTMILAGMIFTIYCACALYIEANGGGTHITDVRQLQLLTKWAVTSEACYVLTMMVLKVSLGIFFARIIVKRWHFILIYVTVGTCVFSSVATFFYVFFRCGPSLDNYVRQQLADKCTPTKLDLFVAYQQAAFNTLTDIIFVVLPILMLWNANMDRRSKFSVGCILCLAALGCICSMIRFRYVDGLTQTDDFFWNVVNISIWSTIEASACIVAGCLATLRPLLKRAIHQAKESTALSGCVKQVSKSIRSGSRSQSNCNSSSSGQQHDTTTDLVRKRSAATVESDPTFLEYLARPGEEVIPLSFDIRNKRTSTESILERPEPVEFPWPVQPKARHQRHKGKREAVHGSFTLQRGTATDERTSEKPTLAPPSPKFFKYAREAV